MTRRVTGGGHAVAPTTGASIDLARTSGPVIVQPLLVGVVHRERLPVQLIAELLGVVVAGVLFGVVAHTAADESEVRASP